VTLAGPVEASTEATKREESRRMLKTDLTGSNERDAREFYRVTRW
jgi:hypothetical protein